LFADGYRRTPQVTILPPKVRFHYGELDYWTFEVNFLEACKPEPAAEDGTADPFATPELRKMDATGVHSSFFPFREGGRFSRLAPRHPHQR
jgi:hypothetical protein